MAIPAPYYRSGGSTVFNSQVPRNQSGQQGAVNQVGAANQNRFDNLVGLGQVLSPGQQSQIAQIRQGATDLIANDIAQANTAAGGGGGGGSRPGSAAGGFIPVSAPGAAMPDRVDISSLLEMAKREGPKLAPMPGRTRAPDAPQRIGGGVRRGSLPEFRPAPRMGRERSMPSRV